jgi:uncharacterized protein YjbJ (UPF0337 family)
LIGLKTGFSAGAGIASVHIPGSSSLCTTRRQRIIRRRPVPFKLCHDNACPLDWFPQVPRLRRSALGAPRTGGTKSSTAVLSRQFSLKSKRSKTMNWDRVEGNWKQFKGNVQQKWGKLTDDDLDVIEGKRTELSGKLQARYGYAKDEAEKNIDSWLNSVN